MRQVRPLCALFALIILAPSLLGTAVLLSAPSTEAALPASSPLYVPNLHNFISPQLEPGDSGQFSFDIQNRYDVNITNVSLTAEIYRRIDIETVDPISAVDDHPLFIGPDSVLETFSVDRIVPQENVSVSFNISSTKKTPDGSYAIRFAIRFGHENSTLTMMSRGHFDDDLWESALNEKNSDTGELNITILGVDGVIPDSAFGVHTPLPMWPFYVLIGITALVGVLTYGIYIQEKSGKAPWVEKLFLRVKARTIRAKRKGEDVINKRRGEKEEPDLEEKVKEETEPEADHEDDEVEEETKVQKIVKEVLEKED